MPGIEADHHHQHEIADEGYRCGIEVHFFLSVSDGRGQSIFPVFSERELRVAKPLF
jgi:hypothetical protein